MKRYILSILVGLLAVGGIGTYYVFGSSDHLPEFRLTSIEGDAAEGAPIVLDGTYGGRMNSESVNVTAEGSDYLNRQENLRNRILNYKGGLYEDALIKKLIKQHRSFMRGKTNASAFFADEERIIHAQSESKAIASGSYQSSFRISILDQRTDKVKELETIISDKNYMSLSVSDVQLVGEQLHIVAVQYFDRGLGSEVYDHIVSLTTGELISSVKLTQLETQADDRIINNSVITNGNTIPSDYVLIKVIEEKLISQSENGYSSSWMADHLLYYSYKSGKVAALPDYYSQTNKTSNVEYGLHENYVISAKFDAEKVVLSRYNLSAEENEQEYTALSIQDLGAEEIRQLIIDDDRVYLQLQGNNGPMVAVLDSSNGQPVYIGAVVHENPEVADIEKMEYLRLRNMTIVSH